MTHVVQLTDLHLCRADAAGEERVRAAIDAVVALDPAPDAVLVTGDLTDTGEREDAERAAELLGALAVPVHVIPGNHDDRDALRAAFGADGSGLFRQAIVVGDLRILACDTLVPGRPEGRLGDEQLAWLARELEGAPDAPTLLALHHPPVRIGVAAIDALMLAGDDCGRLGALVERHAQILAIVCGHVHRAAGGELGGVPVRTAPSAWRQLALDFAAGDTVADIHLSDEPPGYALHRYADGGLTTHIVSVTAPPG
jgi:3',5'-cyclic AMP phosphodiesterase CpdA